MAKCSKTIRDCHHEKFSILAGSVTFHEETKPWNMTKIDGAVLSVGIVWFTLSPLTLLHGCIYMNVGRHSQGPCHLQVIVARMCAKVPVPSSVRGGLRSEFAMWRKRKPWAMQQQSNSWLENKQKDSKTSYTQYGTVCLSYHADCPRRPVV